MRRIHGKIPPPVDVAPVPGTSRAGPLSLPVEMAANPTFDIIVGDPHKVGDLTSAHIVYSVRTKVGNSHTCFKEVTTSDNIVCRPHPRLIDSRNSQLRAATEISSGSIIS